MTIAGDQPFCSFCRKHIVNIVCFNGKDITRRNITEGNIALFMYKKHFCLKWKSNGNFFKKVLEELNIKFKVIVFFYLISMLKVLLNTNINLKCTMLIN